MNFWGYKEQSFKQDATNVGFSNVLTGLQDLGRTQFAQRNSRSYNRSYEKTHLYRRIATGIV